MKIKVYCKWCKERLKEIKNPNKVYYLLKNKGRFIFYDSKECLKSSLIAGKFEHIDRYGWHNANFELEYPMEVIEISFDVDRVETLWDLISVINNFYVSKTILKNQQEVLEFLDIVRKETFE